jgi:hypothetical protein
MENRESAWPSTRLYLEARRLGSKCFEGRRFRARQRRRSVVTDTGYSYKPFDDTKSIFVHIPKCAGISISHALYGNLAGGHTTLDEYLRIFEPEAILSYFKFTIVRNPWDRLVSAFHFLKSGGVNESDKKWSEIELGKYDDFDSFVRGWVNSRNIWKSPHFQPQYHYFLDKGGRISLDFIGRFETLADDFAHIADRIGVRQHLPASNSSNHLPYSEYYSDATKKIVSGTYLRDIAILNYLF